MLRTLSFALAASAALTSPVLAQDDEDKVIDYAPGSTGRITAPLATIVDDAKRQGEQWTMQRWLQTYPGLNVGLFDPIFSERGVAVLVNKVDQGTQPSLSSLLSSGGFALKNWYYRRQLQIAR